MVWLVAKRKWKHFYVVRVSKTWARKADKYIKKKLYVIAYNCFDRLLTRRHRMLSINLSALILFRFARVRQTKQCNFIFHDKNFAKRFLSWKYFKKNHPVCVHNIKVTLCGYRFVHYNFNNDLYKLSFVIWRYDKKYS